MNVRDQAHSTCPLHCGTESDPRVVDAGGITLFICPECLGVAFDAALLADPRRPIDLSRLLRPVIETIRRENSIDPLTQTKNRAFFFRRLAAEIASAEHRSFISVAAFRFDLDGLHEELGSRGADIAVQSIAAALQSAARAGDDLARVEPDTFGLILRNADEVTATEIANRITTGVRATAKSSSRLPALLAAAVASADGKSPEEAWLDARTRAEYSPRRTR